MVHLVCAGKCTRYGQLVGSGWVLIILGVHLEISFELLAPRKKIQIELAKIQLVHRLVLLWEGREIPRLHAPLAKDDACHIFHFGGLLVLLERGEVELPFLFMLLMVVLAL